MPMKIDRRNSALRFGRPARNNGRVTFFATWLAGMFFALTVIWQFDSVQPTVMAFISGPPTATPDGVTLAQLGQEAYWAGDLDTAVYYYGLASEIEPLNTVVQFEYVRVLIYAGYEGRGSRYLAEDALDVAERTVQLVPNDPHAQAAYANALIANDRSDEGAAAALSATEYAPRWAEARAYLALAYWDQGRYSSAQEQAALAVELDPNSVDARRALALALAFTGNYTESIQQYQAAIGIHPRLYTLYFELAPYYIILDNYEGAIQAYDRILASDPRNVKAWTRKCETYFRQREDSLAQESCEQAIELDPSFPEAHRQLGMVRYTRRNYEGSIESFAECIRLMDEQGWPMADRLPECYFLHGLAYYRLDRCEQALPLLQATYQLETSTDRPQELALEGLQLCAEVDENISLDQIPTPIPPTATPLPPIGIY